MENYYWGPEDTSVHFCEDKYIQSPYVAEYANTVSSMAYIYIGMLFLKTKLYKLGWALILVGIGAITLHMTLRAYAQMLDEAAMLVLSFETVSHIKKISRYWIIPIVGAYVFLHNYFAYFFIVFAAAQLYLAYLGYTTTKGLQRAFIITYIVIFCMGTCCWFLDQFACESVQSYQMHAWWHLLTAFSIGFGFMALLY